MNIVVILYLISASKLYIASECQATEAEVATFYSNDPFFCKVLHADDLYENATHSELQEFANKALREAEAAEKILVDKQRVVENLEKAVQEAKALVKAEEISFAYARANVMAAVKAAKEANAQLQFLKNAIKTARLNAPQIKRP